MQRTPSTLFNTATIAHLRSSIPDNQHQPSFTTSYYSVDREIDTPPPLVDDFHPPLNTSPLFPSSQNGVRILSHRGASHPHQLEQRLGPFCFPPHVNALEQNLVRIHHVVNLGCIHHQQRHLPPALDYGSRGRAQKLWLRAQDSRTSSHCLLWQHGGALCLAINARHNTIKRRSRTRLAAGACLLLNSSLPLSVLSNKAAEPFSTHPFSPNIHHHDTNTIGRTKPTMIPREEGLVWTFCPSHSERCRIKSWNIASRTAMVKHITVFSDQASPIFF